MQAGAIRDLEVQAALMDAMGLGDEAVVVLHVGGGQGDALGRFEAGFERLSTPAAQARLVIENDDRTFSLTDVLELHRRTGLRVVWDILHHHCHDPDGIPDREALESALATWPDGVVPKIHYSTPKTALEERTAQGRPAHGARVGSPAAAGPRRPDRPDRVRSVPRDRPRPAWTST